MSAQAVSSASRQYVLDTSVVMHIVRKNTSGRYVVDHFLKGSLRSVISVVTVAEADGLARKHGWQQSKQATLDNLLARFIVVDITRPLMTAAYGEILHQTRTGQHLKLSQHDMWIAALALATETPLLTFDRDFAPLFQRNVIQGQHLITQ